jgi:3-hydroxyacyl-[acyl-carrier-protein] dehydratase
MYTIEQIKKVLPHREPFLMIDRITECDEGKSATAIKAISANEWYFMGHFEKQKVMPGVLMVEAMAQTGAFAMFSAPEMAGKIGFLARIKNAKFSRPVVPGDVLEITSEITEVRGAIGFGSSVCRVDGKLVAKSDIVFAIGEQTE